VRTVTIDPVTRIEGHAKVTIKIDDEDNVEAALHVLELRGFEKILEGMEAEKMPLITARICGVCPAAHHLASAKTLDRAYDVEPPEAAKMLRELMYMGHYIHSHALQLFVLSGPDLLLGISSDPAKRNIVGIIEKYPEIAQKALRLRSLGQKILETVGGRGVHPVTAIAGGMSFSLKKNERMREKLMNYCSEALELGKVAAEVAKNAIFELIDKNPDIFDEITLETYYLGTVKNGKLNLYEGTLRAIDPEGNHFEFDSAEYRNRNYIEERVVADSYMKPTYLNTPGGKTGVLYRVNSLARINCADGMETELAQQEFERFRQDFGHPCHKTIAFHYARVIELLYVCEKAHNLINDDRIMGETQASVSTKPVNNNPIGHVEAPRGTLIHDYEIDEHGRIKKANLIVATQQNYAAINKTIAQAVKSFISCPDEEFLNGIEFCIRCYDPCLSCATHSIGRMPLDVSIFKGDELIRHIRRQ
jgi:F420-non-reducing hydrogenase large subunit